MNTKKSIVSEGIKTKFFPGDWLEVDFQLGRQWIMSGIAFVPCLAESLPLDKDCSVVVVGGGDLTLFDAYPDLAIRASKNPALSRSKTLILSNGIMLKSELLSFCFDLLDRWDVIAPFDDDYHEGSVFVKKGEGTSAFVKQWAKVGFSEALAESGLNVFGLPTVLGG